jgi:hypothetical protein
VAGDVASISPWSFAAVTSACSVSRAFTTVREQLAPVAAGMSSQLFIAQQRLPFRDDKQVDEQRRRKDLSRTEGSRKACRDALALCPSQQALQAKHDWAPENRIRFAFRLRDIRCRTVPPYNDALQTVPDMSVRVYNPQRVI